MKLSIIVPVFNEEANIEDLVNRTQTVIKSINDDFELIFVNDGSSDNTLNLLRQYKMDDRLKIINLSRNFGHQNAVLAGLTKAKGNYIGVMDGDLQDPPEVFIDMFNELENGFDVAYAVRKKRKENFFKKTAYWLYYRLLNKMIDFDFPLDSGDFSLIKRSVLDNMLTSTESNLYLRGTRSWVGFKQTPVIYERQERNAGEPKYKLSHLIKLASNGIFSFSHLPIKTIRSLGYFTIIVSLILLIKVISNYLFYNTAPQGFASLMIAIVFFCGVQLISLGIIGEYIYRIYNETRDKPKFIIKDIY